MLGTARPGSQDLHDFDLRFCPQSLRQIRAQLFVLAFCSSARSSVFTSVRFCFLAGVWAFRRMMV